MFEPFTTVTPSGQAVDYVESVSNSTRLDWLLRKQDQLTKNLSLYRDRPGSWQYMSVSVALTKCEKRIAELGGIAGQGLGK